jgi:SAM-dependent methyltransferase
MKTPSLGKKAVDEMKIKIPLRRELEKSLDKDKCKKIILLDLGCGNCKYVDNRSNHKVIGIDNRKDTEADIVCDINKCIPLKNNFVDKVVAMHTLEHVSDLVKVMEEIWRVCKHNAEVFINVPYFTSSGAYDDPTHRRVFTYRTFDYFTPNFEYEHYTKSKFKIKSKRIMFFGENLPPKMKWLQPIEKIINPIINKFPLYYQSYLAWILPSREIHYILEVIK